jgi:hypothetical protein
LFGRTPPVPLAPRASHPSPYRPPAQPPPTIRDMGNNPPVMQSSHPCHTQNSFWSHHPRRTSWSIWGTSRLHGPTVVRALLHHQRRLLNMVTLCRWGLPYTKEARGLFAASYIEKCVYQRLHHAALYSTLRRG